VSLVVHENLDFALLHHTDAGVCGSKIDTDNYMAGKLVITVRLWHEAEDKTYQFHNSPVMVLDRIVRWLSGEVREERIKERGKRELTSPGRRASDFLAP